MMADPKTTSELKKEIQEAHAEYAAGKITIEEKDQRIANLVSQIRTILIEEQTAQVEAGGTREEIFGKPYVTPVTPWRPESDVAGARADAIQRGKSWSIGDALYDELLPANKRAIIAALRGDEIPEDVSEELNRAIKPLTVGYHQAPDIGVSRIVDVEKGLVTDEQTGDVRQGTPGELFTEALKRQVISTTQEYETIKKIKENELRRKDKQEQQQRNIEARRKELGFRPEGEVSFAEDPLGWLYRQAGFATEQAYEEAAEPVKKAAEKALTYRSPLQEQPTEMPVVEKAPVLQQPRQVRVEPYTRAGLVTESPLGAALRIPNMITGAVAVPVENLMRASEEGKPEQSDIYRRSEIAREYPYQRDYDQYIVNLAKGQGMYQAFKNNPELVGTLDYLPGGGDFWAGVLGMVTEFPIWATPVGAVKPVATGIRATGRGLSRAGMQTVGGGLEAVSAPLEYMKYSAVRAKVDEALEATGTQTKTKDIIDDFYAKPWSSDDWFDKAAKRNHLNKVAPDAVATRVQDTLNLRALLDSGGVNVDELATSPTARAIIDEIEIDTGVRPTRLTQSNAGTYVTKEQDMLKAAAAGDEDFAQLYNLAEEQARQIKDGRAFDPTRVKFNEVDFDARPPQRLNTGKMNIEMQNELARVVFAKEIASGRMGKKEVGRFFMWANLDKGAKQSDELTKVLLQDPKRGGKLGLTTTTASVDDMMNASRSVLSKRAREQMRNFLPEDLIVLAGDVVVNTRMMKNKKAVTAFRNQMKDGWSKIKYEDGVFKVDPVYRMELVSDVIEYVGIETVRQSDKYKDLLHQLTAEMSFTPEHMKVVSDSMVHDAAKIHLDATRLRTGGEQYRRATQPLETRGDVLALSEGKSLPEQFSKGALGDIKRDFIKSFKTIVNKNKDNPPFAKDVEGPAPSTEFADMVRNVDSELDKVQDNFQREWTDLTKETGDPVTALDEMSAGTWGGLRDDRRRHVDETVNRSPFNGSYIAYMDHFVKPDYRDQILKMLNITSLDDIIEEAGPRLERTEAAVKELVQDYALYFTKKDEWTAMLSKYYGTSVSEEMLDGLIRTLIHVDPNAARRLSGGEFVPMQPKASTLLDPNFTNFVEVARRAEQKFQTVRGKGLKSAFGQQQPVAPVMEWILGNRRAAVVSRHQIELMDKNPSFRVELFPDHYSVGMEINLHPLSTQYDSMFVDSLNALRTGGAAIDAAAAGRAMRGLGDRLANKHFDTVSTIPAGDRLDVLTQLNKLIMEQGTINPSVKSMQKQLERQLAIPKAVMDKAVKEEALKMFGNVDGIGEAIKNMQDRTWKLFFEDRPIDSRYYAEPSLSVVQDMLHNWKQFYKTNGMSFAGKMEDTLSANLPLFKRIRGTNDVLIYGNAQMDIVRKLDELASSTRLQTTLDRAGQGVGAAVGRGVGDTVDYFRRTATQGLLAGSFAPNLRYMGQNILTAPFIMMSTVGMARAAKALSFGAQSVFQSMRSYIPKALMAKTAADDMVLVVSKSGRRYTAKQLRNLENKHNLGITRAQAELYATDARSVYRAVGLAGRGQRMSGIERLANYVDPGQRTLFSHMADAQDMAFRRATFYSALADDMPIDQALRLSKRSLLDYGAMAAWEKKFAARYTWFWSFRRQMTSELINALHKSVVGEAGHQYMARVWRAQMRQQQGEGSWLYNDDRAKARLYSVWKEKIDGLDQYTYGYSNPSVEQFESLLSLFSMTASIMYGEQETSEAIKKVLDTGNWNPLLSHMMDSITETHSMTVPPEYIALAKSMGQWEYMKRHYRIAARPIKQRRQGDPVYDDRQQQFAFMDDDGAADFAEDNLLLLGFGLQRTVRDYSRAAIAGDMLGGEGDDYKRFSLPTFTTYSLGLETSLKSYDIKALSPQNEMKIQRELEKLYKNQ
tara:strand:+ start:1393 stop:7059 length:5667 start_codon:yes stop_codon:yes gene_type:complete